MKSFAELVPPNPPQLRVYYEDDIDVGEGTLKTSGIVTKNGNYLLFYPDKGISCIPMTKNLLRELIVFLER